MENFDKGIVTIIFFALIIGLCVFLAWFFIFKVKHLKTPNVYMVDGGVKVGKSLICVMLAVKQYRKNLFKYYIKVPLAKIVNFFRKKKGKKLITLEKPMLYANMPLYHVKFNPLTKDIMLWKYRIPHGSVVLIDEATLLADSMLGMKTEKQKQEAYNRTNETLTVFLKTYGHQTHGGSLFYNSQNVVDLHFAFKRNTNSYLMVFKNRKYPFFMLIDCRELVHDESGDFKNINTSDIDDDNKPLFVSKRWYKYYDRYYLDVLTKNLPLMVNYDVKKFNIKTDKQEVKEIVTFNTYAKVLEYNESKQKELKENAKA